MCYIFEEKITYSRKETEQEVHGGLLTLQEDSRLEKQFHGNLDMMQSKIRVETQYMDIMFNFHYDG